MRVVMRVLVGMDVRMVIMVFVGVQMRMLVVTRGVTVRVPMRMSVIVAVTPRAVVMMVFVHVLVPRHAAPEHVETE